MSKVLNSRQFKMIERFTYDSGHDVKVRTNYSGRCMYGKDCIGFVVDREVNPFNLGMNLYSYLNDLVKDDPDDQDANDLLEYFVDTDARSDSMGLGTIIYFPSISVEKGENEDENDEGDEE